MQFPENLSFKDSTKPATLISFSKQLELCAPSWTLPAGDGVYLVTLQEAQNNPLQV